MTEKYINNILFLSSGFYLFGQPVRSDVPASKNQNWIQIPKKKIVGRIKPRKRNQMSGKNPLDQQDLLSLCT